MMVLLQLTEVVCVMGKNVLQDFTASHGLNLHEHLVKTNVFQNQNVEMEYHLELVCVKTLGVLLDKHVHRGFVRMKPALMIVQQVELQPLVQNVTVLETLAVGNNTAMVEVVKMNQGFVKKIHGKKFQKNVFVLMMKLVEIPSVLDIVLMVFVKTNLENHVLQIWLT